jgi:cell division protein ZapA (FtsZ GTPase activity inhibitor)
MHNIDIEIAGRSYPILVEKEEEIEVLKLVQHLNNEIVEMQARYGTKLNKQDIMAILLLTHAKKTLDCEKNSRNSTVTEKIDELYLMLDAALSR